MAWRRRFGDGTGVKGTVVEGQREISAGSTQYIGEKGGNDAPPTYQDASGAPVENNSPLGYSVGPVTITLLNITMMIGAGIYSTRMFCALARRETILIILSIFYSGWNRFCWCQFCLLDTRLLGMSSTTQFRDTAAEQ